MNTAAEMNYGASVRAGGEGDYKHIYPETRAGMVDREEIRKAFQDHFQVGYDTLIKLTKSLDGKWSDELADWIEWDWIKYRAECAFITEIFGLRIRISDDGHVAITDC